MSGINVGIIGFGTVGAGTVEILTKNREIVFSAINQDSKSNYQSDTEQVSGNFVSAIYAALG